MVRHKARKLRRFLENYTIKRTFWEPPTKLLLGDIHTSGVWFSAQRCPPILANRFMDLDVRGQLTKLAPILAALALVETELLLQVEGN